MDLALETAELQLSCKTKVPQASAQRFVADSWTSNSRPQPHQLEFLSQSVPADTRTSASASHHKLGQYHCWNREYDPATGRWTTPDPAASPFWSLFDYCAQTPNRKLDSSGLYTLESPDGHKVGYKKTVIESVLREVTTYQFSAWTVNRGALLSERDYQCPSDPERCIKCRRYAANAQRDWFWITDNYEDKYSYELEVIKKPVDWSLFAGGAVTFVGGAITVVIGASAIAGGALAAIGGAIGGGPAAPIVVIGGGIAIVAGVATIVGGVIGMVYGAYQMIDALNIGEKVWQVNSAKLLSSSLINFTWARGKETSWGTVVECDKECSECGGMSPYWLPLPPSEGFTPDWRGGSFTVTGSGKGGPTDTRPTPGFTPIK